ncbi:MAG: MerR family transcriptional regulator [Treponema sp.]|jgi:DNA-binding transcriptional MerR regulator|nr:MerR family transcriptional regulator [Treponema sp.]
MTTAEVSAQYGLSLDTLRYYERIGLIPPVTRNRNRIRNFTEMDRNWVGFIKCMRSAGIPVAEAGKSVADSLNGKILYINVMNRLSVDCGCNGSPAAPDGRNLIQRMGQQNGRRTIDHAAAIGLGSKAYELVRL